jgi:hypothetical protein
MEQKTALERWFNQWKIVQLPPPLMAAIQSVDHDWLVRNGAVDRAVQLQIPHVWEIKGNWWHASGDFALSKVQATWGNDGWRRGHFVHTYHNGARVTTHYTWVVMVWFGQLRYTAERIQQAKTLWDILNPPKKER